MEKRRRTKVMVIIILIVVVLGLTVAFAALSQTLTINGIANVDPANWDIHFANLSEAKITGDAKEISSPNVAENKAEITGINVSLNTPKDKVVYEVDLVNEGSINAEIASITSPTFTEEQQKYLDFKVVYTDTNKELSIGDILNSGDTKNLTITIMYKEDISESDLPDEVQNIDITYEITYIQTDNEEEVVTTTPSEEEKTYNVGDEFCIGEECFYVIHDDGDSVTALAKYNLLVGNICTSFSSCTSISEGEENYGKQDSTARGYVSEGQFIGTIAFSGTSYWSDRELTYSAEVYDSNSNLYTYVENYESYLKSLGKTTVDTRLITYNELVSLGCNVTSLMCWSAPFWVYQTSYWSASAYDTTFIWFVNSDGLFANLGYDYSIDFYNGVRPVITISKSEL